MTSVALLPTSSEKETDFPSRSAFVPRKKTVISSVPLRSRFTKAKPNIGRPLASKPKDNLPDNENKPAEKKLQEEKSTVKNTDCVSPIQIAENTSIPTIQGSDNTQSIETCEKGEESSSKLISSLTVQLPNEVSANSKNINIETSDDSKIDILDSSKVDLSIVQNEDLPTSDSIGPTTLSDSCTASPQKDVSVNKIAEYPTLKSILNSPRKRIAPKKTQERRRRLTNRSEAPSRNSMTMGDLIYWNPDSSPMMLKSQSQPVETILQVDTLPLPPPDNNVNKPDEPCNTINSAPKVIINENGEIIIDETSLVVRRKDTIDRTTEVIVENDNTTYTSFRKRSARQWNTKETAKFYKTLSLVGTDFALMESIFKVNDEVTRTRRELKLKFKREEKRNMELVHKVMYESHTFDVSILEEEENEENTPCVENTQEKRKEKESDKIELIENGEINTVDPPIVKKRGRKKKTALGLEETEDVKKTAASKKNRSRKRIVESDDSESISDDILEVYPMLKRSKKRFDPKSVYDVNQPNDMECDNSSDFHRAKRTRKAKVIPDFVTVTSDSNAGSSDSEQEVIEVRIEQEVQNEIDEYAMNYLNHSDHESADNGIFNSIIRVPSSASCSKTTAENDALPPLTPNELDVVCVSVTEPANTLTVLNPANLKTEDNLLTDAAISEVTTSKKIRIVKGPPPKKAPISRYATFTPIEEHKSIQVSKNTSANDTPSRTRTMRSPVAIQEDCINDVKSCLASPADISSQVLGDSSPMMIMTKSPNNQNILHLFMVQSPSGQS